MRANYPVVVLLILSFAIAFSGCSKEEEEKQAIKPALTKEQNYFLDISFGSELNTSGYTNIRKWNSDVRIFIPDSSHAALNDELEKVVQEINALSTDVKLTRVRKRAGSNYVAYFGDKDTYASTYEPNAANHVQKNWGLFWIYWNGNYEITRGSMYVDVIRTKDLDCQKHLLREELTQSLGLMNDSFDYPESIFYQNWTCSPSFAEVDRNVIKIFLSPKIKPGMTRSEVTAVLRNL